MSSYNRINGTYTSEDPALLTGILREQWGYTGLVMTDWFGGSDVVLQMNAGNDLLMPGTEEQRQKLAAALASGALAEAVLDRNVGRVLELILKTPAFAGGAPAKVDLEASARVSRAVWSGLGTTAPTRSRSGPRCGEASPGRARRPRQCPPCSRPEPCGALRCALGTA